MSAARGTITASSAAKRIETEDGGGIFTKKEIISYDDEAGVFEVHVEGTKSGKKFNEKFVVSGFRHPYKGTEVLSEHPGKKLIFDQAIEKNLPLAKFIEAANAANGKGYLSFKLTIKDEKGNVKDIEFGEHDGYSVTAALKLEGDKIKIQNPTYNILAKTLKNGNKKEETISSVLLRNVISSVAEDYFTAKDVVNHIFKEVTKDSSFIKADANKFASEIYAKTMVTNTGVDIFDDTKLKEYKELYCTNGQDRHLKIENITAAVTGIRNGGIDADDYNGTLTVKYHIVAKTSQTSGYDVSEISETHTVKRQGFKQLNDKGPIEEWGLFGLGKDSGGTPEKWKAYNIPSTHLIRENKNIGDNYSNWFELHKEVLKRGNSSGYYLMFNDGAFADSEEAPNPTKYFLAKIDNADILIPQIFVEKKASDDTLTISVSFMGGTKPEKLNITPPKTPPE